MRLYQRFHMQTGFTLAELLIALLILGEIATFTIPKIITSSQNNSYNAKAKEAAAMVSGAYQLYQAKNSVTSSFNFTDLLPYLNYVAADTSSIIDDIQTRDRRTCGSSSSDNCLRLHNGAMLRYGNGSDHNAGGTAATNGVWFNIDPDGKYSGSTTGSGKAVEFWLYVNGRITTYGTILPSTCRAGDCVNPTPAYDPPWFSW